MIITVYVRERTLPETRVPPRRGRGGITGPVTRGCAQDTGRRVAAFGPNDGCTGARHGNRRGNVTNVLCDGRPASSRRWCVWPGAGSKSVCGESVRRVRRRHRRVSPVSGPFPPTRPPPARRRSGAAIANRVRPPPPPGNRRRVNILRVR